MFKLSKTTHATPQPAALRQARTKDEVASQGRHKAWCVYLLELADGSLYCGVAAVLEARLRAHERKRGSKVVAAKLPFRLVYVEFVSTEEPNARSAAQRREYAIKQLSRSQKRELVDEYLNGCA